MTYPDAYFIAREAWRDWRIEAQTLIQLARVAPGARVLEIGCGGGGLVRSLSALGAQTVGVDPLESALALAHSRPSASPCRAAFVQVSGIGHLPFRSGVFDAVVGQHVIEHLDDVNAALCEWKRLLRPGGCIAVATPNARYPDPAHFSDSNHAHIFVPEELRAAAERAGLVVDACFTIFPYLSHIRLLRALGVLAFRAFKHAPYFASRGRTILLRAVAPG